MNLIDTIKGVITYLTASIVVIGAMILAFMAWAMPIPKEGGRDIAILFGFLGLVVGAAVAFLFNSESATRATRASERSAVLGTTATNGHGTEMRNLDH